MSQVALIRCISYDFTEVKNAIRKGIELLGGIQKYIRNDENILLKPNLLTGADPERCITTHPQVFRAISEILMEHKFTISYGDRPGIVSLATAAKKSGLAWEAEQLKIPMADFNKTYRQHFEEGILVKAFDLYQAVADNRALISLPKFKTHSFTKITGAVKNQFGCLSFISRREFHVTMNEPVIFSKMILDLNKVINPRLYIIDAVEAMEGDGPMGGYPKKLNLIAISADPIALDATLCRIIDLEPSRVPSVFYGAQFGYGAINENEIEILGDSLKGFINKDFLIDRSQILHPEKAGLINSIFRRTIRKPKVHPDKCTRCGNCIEACPTTPKAIAFRSDSTTSSPEINYSLCISCFCCYEMCSDRAISLSNPLFRRMISTLRS